MFRLWRSCNLIGLACQRGKFHDAHLDKESLVAGFAVAVFEVVADVEVFEQQCHAASEGLFTIAATHTVAHLHQFVSCGIECHQQVAQVHGEAGHEMLSVETSVNHLLVEQHRIADIAIAQIFHQTEIIIVVKDVEVFDAKLIGEVAAGEADHLVEDRERVAQTSFGFVGDDMQSLGFVSHTFALCHIFEVVYDVLALDTFEVEHLAAGENRGKDFVFLGGSEDELGVGGRFLKSFEEGVESSL